jgi:aldehyde dehydrogenase (NAD+)
MSVESVKRTWVDYGEQRDWSDAICGQGEEFLVRATEPKNIWIPAGVSFGN